MGKARQRLRSPAMNPFDFLIPIALIAVLAALAFGIYALFRGGDFGVLVEQGHAHARGAAAAVIVLVGALLWKQSHG